MNKYTLQENKILASAENGHKVKEEELLGGKKKIVSTLGLKFVKIDCCQTSCMLYHKDDIELIEYKFCGLLR